MRQQAVIVFDESQTISLDELNQFYAAVLAEFPEASGFASRGESLVFGNFSDVDDATFKARLKTAATKAGRAPRSQTFPD
jgi:hypothetical protein